MQNGWREPVRIREKPGVIHEVTNVETALRVIDWWKPTRKWHRSVDVLIQVQMGNATVEEGRAAFVAAAREAGALIGE